MTPNAVQYKKFFAAKQLDHLWGFGSTFLHVFHFSGDLQVIGAMKKFAELTDQAR